MDPEHQNTLVQSHPLLYRKGMTFDSGEGWFALLQDLSAALEALCTGQREAGQTEVMVAVNVTEKLGGLRFYVEFGLPGAYEPITDAQNQSTSICERCGAPGQLRNIQGWRRTRCMVHDEEAEVGDLS